MTRGVGLGLVLATVVFAAASADAHERIVDADGDDRHSRRTPLRDGSLYPLDVAVVRRGPLAGPAAAGCFNAEIEVEHDCPEAQTCGCQSAVLSVVVGGELLVLQSRLDEISNVFEPDVIPLNLTLCDLSLVLGRPAGDGDVHNAQAGFHFVEVEATLRHGQTKKVMASACRNLSLSGEAADCRGTHESRLSRRSAIAQTSPSGDATTVRVEGVAFSRGRDSEGLDEGVCRGSRADQGQCTQAHLEQARKMRETGHGDEALRLLNLVAANGDARHGGGQEEEALLKRRAALERMALLPPFALTGRCCDSTNVHCRALDASVVRMSDSEAERQLMNVIGEDQCEGTFVEVGGGDGITDSLSLYLEKAMGWRGLILEGNETQFVALRGSGRRANLTKAFAAGSKEEERGQRGVDVREEIERHFDVTDETQAVSVMIVNEVGESQVSVLKALNTSLVLGQHGMPVPICSVLAVVSDVAVKEQVTQLLAAKSYHAVADAGEGPAAGESEEGEEEAAEQEPLSVPDGGGVRSPKKQSSAPPPGGTGGRVYDFFLWSPSMEEMAAAGVDVMMTSNPTATASEEDQEDGQQPEIEYHVSDDGDEDEGEQDDES